MGQFRVLGIALWVLWMLSTRSITAVQSRQLTTLAPNEGVNSLLAKLTPEEQNELSKYLEEKIQHLKLRLHEQFEMARLRRKRETNSLDLSDRQLLQEQHFRVGGVSEFAPRTISDYNVTCWASAPNGKDKQLIALGTERGDFLLFDFNGNDFKFISATKLSNVPYQAAFFEYNRSLWLVVAYGNYYELDDHYIDVYTLRRSIFYRRQQIRLDGPSSLNLVISKGKIHMLVTTYSKRSNVGTTRRATIRLYKWQHTQFDIIASQETHGARSVVSWDMKGTLYVAVAQEQDDSGDYLVGSPVFVYNVHEDEKLTYIQIIRTAWPTKVAAFTLEGSNYLIFVGMQEARILWWAGEQFLEWQILNGTKNAVDVQIMYLPNGEIMIAIALKTKILFFTEDSSSKYIMTYEFKIAAEITSIKFLYSLGKFNFLTLTLRAIGPTIPANVYRMNFETYETVDYSKWDPLVACLIDLNKTLTQQDRRLEYLRDRVDKVWTGDETQEVTADVIVKGNVNAPSIHIANLVITTNETNVPSITHSQIREGILKATEVFHALSFDMQTVVLKSKEQPIEGVLAFSVPVNVRKSWLGIANNEVILNNIPVSMLATKALLISGDQVITGNFEFQGIKADALFVSGRINGIDMDDLLLVHGNQHVRGQLQFGEVRMLQNLVIATDATVNGISPTNWVTTANSGNQVIDGLKTFAKLNVDGQISVRHLTNGIDLSQLVSRIVLTDVDQVITGRLTFAGPLHVRGDINLRGLINGAINLTYLLANAVDRTSEEEILGRKTFLAPVFVTNNVFVRATVNDIDLSEQIVTTNTQQTVTGHWIINSPVHFEHDLITGTVNGIDLSEEVVLKSNVDQTITGLKIFTQPVNIETNVVMPPGEATINNIVISALPHLLVMRDDVVLAGETIFENIVLRRNAKAYLGINGFIIKDLEPILWRKSVPQTITVPVHFLGTWELHQHLEVNTTINGFDIKTDLVHTFGNETITGVKTFVDEVTSNRSIIVRDEVTINGVDWSALEKLVARTSGEYSINGRKIFSSLDVFGNIIVKETVNGLNLLTDVMLVDQEQTIHGTTFFTTPVIYVAGDALIRDDIVAVYVDGIDLSSFIGEIVLIDEDGKKPIRNKDFQKGMQVLNIDSSGYIDGVHIDEIKMRTVTVNTQQEILAHKTFNGTSYFQDVLNVNLLNGLDVVKHVDSVVLRTKHESVRGLKILKGNILVNNITVKGTVNGINILDFSEKALSLSGDNVILAHMTFDNAVTGSLVLETSSFLDGIQLSDFVLLDRDSVLLGKIHFMNDVIVDGNVEVKGFVSGCNLTQFAEDAVYTVHEHQQLFGSKTLRSLEVHGNIFISRLVNGIDLGELYSQMVTKSTNQTILAPLIFEDGFIVDNLVLNNNVNEVNLTYIFSDAVFKSLPQIITGDKIFTSANGIEVMNNFSCGNMEISGTVNNVNVQELVSTTVTTYGNQQIYGKKHFSDIDVNSNITVNGEINGISLSDIVLTYTSESIAGVTSFLAPTYVEGNLTVGGLIDETDLQYLVNSRITLDGKDVFESELIFEDAVTIMGNLQVTEMVNGIPIHSIVTRHANFPIDGHKTFTQNFTIGNDLEVYSINGINITALSKNIIRSSNQEEILGTTVFKTIEAQSDIVMRGPVNNVRIAEAHNYFIEHANQIEEAMQFLSNTLEDQRRNINEQFAVHRHQLLAFKYFNLVQELNIGPTKKILLNPIYNFYRSMNFTYATSTITIWGSNTARCYGCGCCHEYTTTTVVEVDADGTLSKTAGPYYNRHFPFIFGGQLAEHQTGFLVLTNSTSSNKHCHSKYEEETTITLIQDESTDNHESPLMYKQSNTPFISSANLFSGGGSLYMVLAVAYDKRTASHHTNSTVLRLDKENGTWSQHQLLETFEPVDTDVITINSGREEHPIIYLAIANRMKVKGIPMPSVVYSWDWKANKFVLFKKIRTNFVSSIRWVQTESDIFLVVANEKAGLRDSDVHSNQYTEPVNVYKATAHDLEWYQSIYLPAVIALDSFRLIGETYVLAASRYMETTYLLRWEGVNGFRVIQELMTPGVEDVRSYWSNNADLAVIVASSTGSTKVMKAVVGGPTIFSRISGSPPFETPEEIWHTKNIEPPSSYFHDFPFVN